MGMGLSTFPLFQNHYPERMGQIVALNPPSFYANAIHPLFMPMIDPVTREKVVVISGSEQYQAYADKFWRHDSGMRCWLESVHDMPGLPGSFPNGRLNQA